jgi:hypothetical protein
MKRLILCVFMLYSVGAAAQKFGRMNPNRFTYISAGAAYPYVGGKIGFEFRPRVFLEGQALTDGGGIWKENQFNDWRSLSLVRSIPINPLRSEIRLSMGIVQSEERVLSQKANTFGVAPQIGYTLHLHPKWAASSSITWPLSSAANLTPGVLFSMEYRIGRYVKENGLY